MELKISQLKFFNWKRTKSSHSFLKRLGSDKANVNEALISGSNHTLKGNPKRNRDMDEARKMILIPRFKKNQKRLGSDRLV